MPPTSLPLAPEARTALLKVPVTLTEKERIQSLAAAENRSVAEFVRLALPLAHPHDGNPFAGIAPAAIVHTTAS